jgi:hypothetical protein
MKNVFSLSEMATAIKNGTPIQPMKASPEDRLGRGTWLKMKGYSEPEAVILRLEHTKFGDRVHFVQLPSHDDRAPILRTVETIGIRDYEARQGIGWYFHPHKTEPMSEPTISEWVLKAEQHAAYKKRKQAKAGEEQARITAIGEEWLLRHTPDWPVAALVARLESSECDSMTDYYGSKTTATVLLGFSRHKRDIFSEMRSAAATFAPTADLATADAKEVEQREKYSMGHGYYLGRSRYSGWQVQKVSRYGQDGESTAQWVSRQWNYAVGLQIEDVNHGHLPCITPFAGTRKATRKGGLRSAPTNPPIQPSTTTAIPSTSTTTSPAALYAEQLRARYF